MLNDCLQIMSSAMICVTPRHTACVPPLQGNQPTDSEFCVLSEEFKKAVTKADGFEWTNDQPEGHTPKVQLSFQVSDSKSFSKLRLKIHF